ncbi:MAG TPA: hypothetical protein VGI35_08025 [Steroidobacteraceae bacterium]
MRTLDGDRAQAGSDPRLVGGPLGADQQLGPSAAGGRRGGSVVGRFVLHALNLVIASGAFAAYQHFSLAGQSTPALVSLIVAGGFLLAPVRAVLHAVFAIEHRVLHVVHGIGGLAFVALAGGGVISGGPVLSHAALAPFAIMGAAQAVMHQNHPRDARQAEALRRFAQSLPEVGRVTQPGSLSSPEGAARAVAALSDIIGKAQALGETELESDPGFQGALRRVTTRTGLTLGLDTVDQAFGRLAADPAVARQIPSLRRRLAAARRTLAQR